MLAGGSLFGLVGVLIVDLWFVGRRPHEPSYNLPGVRALCSFTTHTPVEAGHDQFEWSLVREVLDGYVEWEELKKLAGEHRLNMTRLALNLSEYVNGVARRHAEVSQRMFPGYSVNSVTNGVHPGAWTSKSFAELYDRRLPGWCNEPMLLVRVDQIPDEEVWNAHIAAKAALVERVTNSRYWPETAIFVIEDDGLMKEYQRDQDDWKPPIGVYDTLVRTDVRGGTLHIDAGKPAPVKGRSIHWHAACRGNPTVQGNPDSYLPCLNFRATAEVPKINDLEKTRDGVVEQGTHQREAGRAPSRSVAGAAVGRNERSATPALPPLAHSFTRSCGGQAVRGHVL